MAWVDMLSRQLLPREGFNTVEWVKCQTNERSRQKQPRAGFYTRLAPGESRWHALVPTATASGGLQHADRAGRTRPTLWSRQIQPRAGFNTRAPRDGNCVRTVPTATASGRLQHHRGGGPHRVQHRPDSYGLGQASIPSSFASHEGRRRGPDRNSLGQASIPTSGGRSGAFYRVPAATPPGRLRYDLELTTAVPTATASGRLQH